MSSHIWDTPTHRFKSTTVTKIIPALQVGRYHGLANWEDLCRWLGYALELQRQGGSMGFRDLQVKLADAQHAGYKFCKGKNKDNYLKAGEALLSRVAYRVKLPDDTPAYAILDKLQEDGLLDTPDGIRPLDVCGKCERPCSHSRYHVRPGPTSDVMCSRCQLKNFIRSRR